MWRVGRILAIPKSLSECHSINTTTTLLRNPDQLALFSCNNLLETSFPVHKT